MHDIKKNILATLVYFDVFDFPLKVEEIFEWLVNFRHLGVDLLSAASSNQPMNLGLVKKELDELVLEGAVDRAGEYYFLFDREYLIPLRLKREKIAKRKWRIARRAVWWMRFAPFIKAVFASGSLAMNNTDELSDLDVLTVAKHGRIWLARFFLSGLLSLLYLRRRGRDRIAPDKICLNHYITDKSLTIDLKSVYNAQTYAGLVPMYACDKSLNGDFKKANGWVLDYVFNWGPHIDEIGPRQGQPLLAKLAEWFLDKSRLADMLENLTRRLQTSRIARNPATNSAGGRVVFNDNYLEFHPGSIEVEVIREYNNRLARIGIADLAKEKDSGLVPSGHCQPKEHN